MEIALVELYLPPIPVPSPPRTSPYWDRHFQILDPRQCLWVPCDVLSAVGQGKRKSKGRRAESSHPRYSESAPLIPRPQGWQSHTPAVSHVHIARCTRSEAAGISGLSRGFTRRPMGAFWQERQSRRCLSRMTAGAGGLIAQFWSLDMLSVASSRTRRQLGNKAHPTDDGAAFATLGNHVPSTVPSLAVVIAAPGRIFHIVPVASPGAVSQSRFGVDRQLLVGAVDGRLQEDGAVLQEGVVDASTGARQAVEIV